MEESAIYRRHEVLYRLGYRLVEFPYMQPPLSPGGEPFDRIHLLIYVGKGDGGEDGGDKVGDHTVPIPQGNTIAMSVPFDFVSDFYGSVFGYRPSSLELYEGCRYYSMARKFAKGRDRCAIKPNLPFWDVAESLEKGGGG